MSEERLPPHDIAAEEAVLGSLLVDSTAIVNVIDVVQTQDFFREQNQWLCQACLDLYYRQEPVTQVTLAHELSRQGRLEAAGGVAYILHLISTVPTSVHAKYYAQIVHRLAIMRSLIAAGGQIAALGYQQGPDEDATLDRAEDVLFNLRHGQRSRDFVSIKDELSRYFEESPPLALEEASRRLPRIFTDFSVLDELLGGLQRSDLIILGARPSQGKTSLAMCIARNAAVRQKARVAIFSLEMAREALVQRFLSTEAEVDTMRVRLRLYSEEEERRIIEASGVLADAPIFIDDSALLRLVELRSKARRLWHDQGIDLIIIDYLQLIQGSGRSDNRVQEVTEISRGLKALARELDLPILALSQLSRALQARASHRPLLSDLRESGSLEQDADVVLFIHRDELFFTEEEWLRQNFDKPYPKGEAAVIVAKHRNGPVGEVMLHFKSRFAKFDDLRVREEL